MNPAANHALPTTYGFPPYTRIWVLSPFIETSDSHLDYYYDFSQSIAEYQRVFSMLRLPWHWQPVTLDNYAQIIEQIEAQKNTGTCYPLILNLCDGDEVNGTPGISVVRLLEEKQLPFTGADAYFYQITTSKITMKQAFDNAGIAHADWAPITTSTVDIKNLLTKLGSPLIIKPSVSGGSMGVGIKNVVDNEEAILSIIQEIENGYRGWNLTADGIIAEKFIAGAEFTCFISGSYHHPDTAIIYTPVERVFHPSLPEKERFLSFDRLWEIYEEESAMPGDENFYEYRLPIDELIEPIKKLSWEAFCTTKGKGYTRVDLRTDSTTGKLYVLEVNAQCGISEDENFTSIGAILKFSNKSFTSLVAEILQDAIVRNTEAMESCGHLNNDARA